MASVLWNRNFQSVKMNCSKDNIFVLAQYVGLQPNSLRTFVLEQLDKSIKKDNKFRIFEIFVLNYN